MKDINDSNNHLNDKNKNNKKSSNHLSNELRSFRAMAIAHSLCQLTDYQFLIRLPSHNIEELMVPRDSNVITLKVMIQRNFNIPFEEQVLFINGELLEDNSDLSRYFTFYNNSTTSSNTITTNNNDSKSRKVKINIIQKKVYRSIGTVHTKIKTAEIISSIYDDYILNEVIAPLPPTEKVFRHVAYAIRYLLRLDRMQAENNIGKERIWKIIRPTDLNKQYFKSFNNPNSHNQRILIDRIRKVIETSKEYDLRENLHIPSDIRTLSEIRNIKKWLNELKYFIDANLSDQALLDVSKYMIYRSYKAGDYIFRQGDIGNYFYIVISGYISLSAQGCGYFGQIYPGLCFGEISLFQDNAIRAATAIVDFITPYAELALIGKEVYRRSMSLFKQNSLAESEKLLMELQCLHLLPKEAFIRIAYAVEKTYVRPKEIILEQKDDVKQLIFLLKGEYKIIHSYFVSEIKEKLKNIQFKDTNDTILEKKISIMDVFRPPKIFGQECCIRRKSSISTYTLQAVKPGLILTLSMDHLQNFILPYKEVIQLILKEHYNRIEESNKRLHDMIHEIILSNTTTTTTTTNNNNNNKNYSNQNQNHKQIKKNTNNIVQLINIKNIIQQDNNTFKNNINNDNIKRNHKIFKNTSKNILIPSSSNHVFHNIKKEIICSQLPFYNILKKDEQMDYYLLNDKKKLNNLNNFANKNEKQDSLKAKKKEKEKMDMIHSSLRNIMPVDVQLLHHKNNLMIKKDGKLNNNNNNNNFKDDLMTQYTFLPLK